MNANFAAGFVCLTLAVGVEAQVVECPGDLNGDTTVTIDELVRSVRTAVSGCEIAEPRRTTHLSVFTDRGTYEVGETATLSIRLLGAERKSWWSSYRFRHPPHPTNDPLRTCVVNFRISRGHFFIEEILYERVKDRESFQTCALWDGGPRRVQTIIETPPAFEISEPVELVQQGPDRTESPLLPGIYYIEAELRLGMIPEKGDPLFAPHSPRLKGGVHIEIVAARD